MQVIFSNILRITEQTHALFAVRPFAFLLIDECEEFIVGDAIRPEIECKPAKLSVRREG
jgi:hypothetical protein